VKYILSIFGGAMLFLSVFTAGCNLLGDKKSSLANDTTLSLEAREWSKKIDEYPDNDEYLVQRAEVFTRTRRYDLAIDDYVRAISSNGEKCEYNISLGDVYFAADQTTNALESYQNAEKVCPLNEEAIFKRAQFLYFVRQFSKSKIAFGKLLNVSPQHGEGHFFLAMLNKEDGDTAAAIGLFEKTIKLKGADYNSCMQLALIHETLGDSAKALTSLNRAINTDGRSAEAYYSRGLFYQKQGKDKLATKDYQKTIDIDAGYTFAYYNVGNILASQGNFIKAIDHFEICLRLSPNSAKTYNRIGQCFELLGKKDQAIVNFEKCLQIDPNFAPAKEGLTRSGRI
jgi:tetratricopeptide (TPR) repeat protein